MKIYNMAIIVVAVAFVISFVYMIYTYVNQYKFIRGKENENRENKLWWKNN